MLTGDGLNNREAFRDWVGLYSNDLYHHSIRQGLEEDTAKDLVQDTFSSAWRSVDGYKGIASVKNWLFVILKNKIADHFRKQSNRLDMQHLEVDDYNDLYFDNSGHWKKGSHPQSWNVNLFDVLESKEFYAVFSNCSGKINHLQRAVFIKKYVDGMDSGKICKELKITSSNYWVLLHRAKIQLRACMERNWFIK